MKFAKIIVRKYFATYGTLLVVNTRRVAHVLAVGHIAMCSVTRCTCVLPTVIGRG